MLSKDYRYVRLYIRCQLSTYRAFVLYQPYYSPRGKFNNLIGTRGYLRDIRKFVVLSFILYRNIKFVQIIIRNNIVTIMDDN